nr:hypothetical protein [Tanacetum cinerariifolium]
RLQRGDLKWILNYARAAIIGVTFSTRSVLVQRAVTFGQSHNAKSSKSIDGYTYREYGRTFTYDS